MNWLDVVLTWIRQTLRYHNEKKESCQQFEISIVSAIRTEHMIENKYKLFLGPSQMQKLNNEQYWQNFYRINVFKEVKQVELTGKKQMIQVHEGSVRRKRWQSQGKVTTIWSRMKNPTRSETLLDQWERITINKRSASWFQHSRI